MTMHDDVNPDMLERDLKLLAEPRQSDDRLRRALRGRLTEQLPPRPRRQLSLRIAFAVAVAAAAAAVAAVLGTSGSGGPSPANAAIIHHALRAVTSPANEILHVKVVGVQNGVSVGGEWWQQTSAPYASRGIKGEVGHEGEAADNGRTSFQYEAATNTIHEQPDSSPPTFTDPISLVRQELANGRAQVAGTVVIDGVSLYKINLPNGLVGYFDRSTYMPRYLDDPQQDGADIVRLRVVTYEYLPMTESNRTLLNMIAQHPTARIDTNPSPTAGGK